MPAQEAQALKGVGIGGSSIVDPMRQTFETPAAGVWVDAPNAPQSYAFRVVCGVGNGLYSATRIFSAPGSAEISAGNGQT